MFMATCEQAIEHLQRFAAITPGEAATLPDAVVAVGEEAIDAIAAEEPLPTSLADVRAARSVRRSLLFESCGLGLASMRRRDTCPASGRVPSSGASSRRSDRSSTTSSTTNIAATKHRPAPLCALRRVASEDTPSRKSRQLMLRQRSLPLRKRLTSMKASWHRPGSAFPASTGSRT